MIEDNTYTKLFQGPWAICEWPVHSVKVSAYIDGSFLHVPVGPYTNLELFKFAEVLVNTLACVNDCAERGTTLMQTNREARGAKVIFTTSCIQRNIEKTFQSAKANS